MVLLWDSRSCELAVMVLVAGVGFFKPLLFLCRYLKYRPGKKYSWIFCHLLVSLYVLVCLHPFLFV